MNRKDKLPSQNAQGVQLKLNHHKGKHDNFRFGECYNKIVDLHCTVEMRGSLGEISLRFACNREGFSVMVTMSSPHGDH